MKKKGFLKKFKAAQISPRRKARIDKRREKFFEGKIDLDEKRTNNKKRALFSIVTRSGYKYKPRLLERTRRDKTIIDVLNILKNNSNN